MTPGDKRVPRLTPYRRRVLAAVISLVSLIISIPLLASVGHSPVMSAVLVLVGAGLATVYAALGRRIMKVPSDRRRGWLRLRAPRSESPRPDNPAT